MSFVSNVDERTKVYCSQFDPSDTVVTTFDPMSYLVEFSTTFIDDTHLFICERKHTCKCISANLCTCDMDDFRHVTRSSLTLGSACNYILQLTLRSKLNLEKKKNLLRIFKFTDDEDEVPICDIGGSTIKFYQKSGGHVSFTIRDKVEIRNNDIYLKFDYMSFIQVPPINVHSPP